MKIARTGRYLESSSEFEVTYPDGHVGTLWSPPWHELTDLDEELGCRSVADMLFRQNKHRVSGRVEAGHQVEAK